jgi:hypothetical protein
MRSVYSPCRWSVWRPGRARTCDLEIMESRRVAVSAEAAVFRAPLLFRRPWQGHSASRPSPQLRSRGACGCAGPRVTTETKAGWIFLSRVEPRTISGCVSINA